MNYANERIFLCWITNCNHNNIPYWYSGWINVCTRMDASILMEKRVKRILARNVLIGILISTLVLFIFGKEYGITFFAGWIVGMIISCLEKRPHKPL